MCGNDEHKEHMIIN